MAGDDLTERLNKVVPSEGMHEDNSTELFDIDDANDTMAEAAARLTALEQENKRLREALERSIMAIDDWLNIYAEEHCDEARVEEAKCRVYEHGTLAYIADVQQQNRSALTHEDMT